MTITRNGIWATARLAGGAAIVAALVVRMGADPFVEGLRRVDAGAVVVALIVTGVTTVACAWRWSLIAGRLGLVVSVPAGVAAYYRSQFLNATLPGGVLGDVDRAVTHGRDAGDLGRSARAVWWERVAGQVVLVTCAVLALLVLPSPWRPGARTGSSGDHGPWSPGLPVLMAAALIVAVVLGMLLVRLGLVRVVLASALAAAGHAVIFLVAARSAGVTAPVGRLLPVALVVLIAAAVPLNVAGWGPREGAAAWAFGAAGLGAAQGFTVAVVYGVLAFVATLPGALLVLPARWRHGGAVGPALVGPAVQIVHVAPAAEGAGRG